MLDLRIPIGIMFSTVGLLMLAYGLFTCSDADMYAKSLNININAWWGGVLTAFGAFMWLGSLRRPKSDS